VVSSDTPAFGSNPHPHVQGCRGAEQDGKDQFGKSKLQDQTALKEL